MPSVRRGTFRPVVCWLGISAILFLGQYHYTQASKATMQFTVSMEGRSGQILHEATLNGLPYRAGQPCGVGSKKLVVRAEDAEAFETNRFVWYAGADFGKIVLARTRGQMNLEFSPAAETVQVVGAEEKKSLYNVTRQSLSLPTGRYTVTVKFKRFTVERTEEIARNQTTPVAVFPNLTVLDLRSDPEKAEFEITSTKPHVVSVSGSTPAIITDLPAGDYQLTIARGDYRKQLPVLLTGVKATNDLKVEFRYAKLSISSDPSDAIINDGRKVIGKTPASFELQPGSYRFQIAKDGFFATNLNLTLSESDTPMISVTLANVSFVEALERARLHSIGGINDDLALAAIEQALRIKPGDETALAMKREIEFDRHLRKAWLLERKSAFGEALSEVNAALRLNATHPKALVMKSDLEKALRAAEEQREKIEKAAAAAQAKAKEVALAAQSEARRNRPEKVLQDYAIRLPHHEAFQNHLIRVPGVLDAVREQVVRALGRKPEWSILRDDKPDKDTIILLSDLTGVISKQRVAMVIGQAADNEVVIAFKLLSLSGLKGIADNRYEPFTSQNEPPVRAAIIEERLARELREFKKRIEEELH